MLYYGIYRFERLTYQDFQNPDQPFNWLARQVNRLTSFYQLIGCSKLAGRLVCVANLSIYLNQLTGWHVMAGDIYVCVKPKLSSHYLRMELSKTVLLF